MEENTISSSADSRRFWLYPSYKDSGVEWLGKIPAHWRARRLKYLSRIIMGQSPPSEIVNTFGEGLPFLQGNADFGTEHPTARTFCPYPPKIAALEDILISVRAPVGAINSADREYGIGRGLCAIRPFIRQLERRYCSFLLQIARSQLDSIATGSTYDAVSADDVSCLLMLMPSIEEQQIIVSALDRETAKIDALIEKKERLIELLQEKRKALITQAVTKGLDPTVPMKDSGIEWLGEIPTHWALVPLKSLTLARPGSIKTGPFGSQLLASDMAQEEIKVYNQRNVITHDFTAGENYISMNKFRELASFEVFKNDILVTTRGTIGKSAIVPNGAERGILHPCLLRIQPDSDKIKIAYLALIIQESNLVINQLALASNATTIDVIYSDTIGRVLIPCPPMNEQSAIFEFLDGMTAKIDALKSSIQEAIASLREYRTALISAAVTGKIDVREA